MEQSLLIIGQPPDVASQRHAAEAESQVFA